MEGIETIRAVRVVLTKYIPTEIHLRNYDPVIRGLR